MTFETALLETTRLILRPFSEAHLSERYVAWLNDPATVRYSEQRHVRHTSESCRRFWRELIEGQHDFWAIELRRKSAKHIGNVVAYRDRVNEVAEVSILIGEADERGKGYGEEAWCAVVDHLLTDPGVRRVKAGAMAANVTMLRLFERSGMRIEERRKDRFLLDGTPVDLVQACRWATDLGSASG